jgi:hypothetical protein
MRPLPSSGPDAFMIVSCALVVLFTPASTAARDLTFEERVAAQEAIERVYSAPARGNEALRETVPRGVGQRCGPT